MLIEVTGGTYSTNTTKMIVEVHPTGTVDEILDCGLDEINEAYREEYGKKGCVVIKEVRNFIIDGKTYTSINGVDKCHYALGEDDMTIFSDHCEYIEYSGRTRGKI